MLFGSYGELKEFIEENKNSEQRNCEFKSANAWDGDFKYKIVRAILCMANKKNGGSIIIGVDENKIAGTFNINELDESTAKTYNGDEVMQFVNDGYADPSVSITLQKLKNESTGKPLINIHVSEFESIPISCKKDYKDILQTGKIYSRSFSKQECTPNLSSEELREIIDLAKDKAVKKEISHLKEIGVIPSFDTLQNQTSVSDEQKFESERKGF